MLSGDTAADVEKRCLLRNLTPRVDEYPAHFSFVLLAGLWRESDPILNGATPRDLITRPTLFGPTPLEVNVFLFQILAVNSHVEFWPDEQEALGHAVMKSVGVLYPPFMETSQNDRGSRFSSPTLRRLTHRSRVNQIHRCRFLFDFH